MPMVWNAEADAKLLMAIVQVYDVKIKGAKMREVAEIMGPECTESALTHRLQKIRAKAIRSGEGEGTNDPKATGKKTQKKTTAKPSAAPKNGKGAKKQTTTRTPSPEAGFATPPESATRQSRAGAKRNYADMGSDGDADDDDDGLDKKVNIEVGEDIGEGLRSAPSEDVWP